MLPIIVLGVIAFMFPGFAFKCFLTYIVIACLVALSN